LSSPDLTDPKSLKRFLDKHGLSPKKGLGQHWLFSSNAVEAIVRGIPPAGGILEIGPGAGVLTQRAISIAPVIAMDLDPRVERALEESAPGLTFVLGDVLEVDLREVLLQLGRPRVVLSNLPYYISTAVIERVVDHAELIDRGVLMIQKEVGERIAAPPGDRRRGAISVLTQAGFEINTVARVPPGAFLPPPKVSSVVLRMDRKPQIEPIEKRFLYAAFKQPRKTLLNNLIAAGFEKIRVEDALNQIKIRPDCRPNLLDLDHWHALEALLHIPKS
jgi:16S rRNA (adenine1518-N6/adenine1519-N6)-dimethyltransferase